MKWTTIETVVTLQQVFTGIGQTLMSRPALNSLADGQWFFPGTPASSTTKTGCHDIAEILLKDKLRK
jgi:hypothetical protein